MQGWRIMAGALCAALLGLFPDLAHAATAAYIIGPPNEFVSDGKEWSFAAPQTEFQATHPDASTVLIDFETWHLRFASAPADTLLPGNYEDTLRTHRGRTPGLDVSGESRGCNVAIGWFRVHEVVYSDTTVVRFAADFLQYCDGMPPIFGAIRFNSDVPLHRDQPYARAVGRLVAAEGDTVTLDGSSSFDRVSTVSHRWAQTSGPPVFDATSAPELTFTAPPVPPGGADLRFALTVMDSEGNSDVIPVELHVFDETDPRTRFRMDSERYDYIGQGRVYTYDEANSVMIGSITYGYPDYLDEAGLQINIEGRERWRLVLAMPKGQALAPGVQGIVQRYPFRTPDRPGINFSGEGRGCNRISGWFEIIEVEVVGSTVNKLAADIRHTCADIDTSFFGPLRFNSSVPFDRDVVYAVADRDVTLQEGQPLVLNGSASYSHDAPISSYSWTQVAGPTAIIADPNAAMTPVTLPAVPLEGLELEFSLRIADSQGRERTDAVTVRVRSKRAKQDYLLVESDHPYDWVGKGLSLLFTADQSVFTVGRGEHNGIDFSTRGGEQTASLDLAAPFSLPLLPGRYDNAAKYSSGSGSTPHMNYAQLSSACGNISGWFNVISLIEAGDGSIDTAAIDLEQHCEYRQYATFARLRINVAPDNEAHADAGSDQYVAEGTEGTLDGTASTGGKAPVAKYAWSQVYSPNLTTVALTGANTANPTFTAPALTSGRSREEYRFALNVTDEAGFTDRDVVAITVVRDVTDTDGDGAFDFEDAYPANANESANSDGDAFGDNADTDDDNDGVMDSADLFRTNPAEHADFDGDGKGDNSDEDDDEDRKTDIWERYPPNGDGNKDGIPDERQFEVLSGTDGYGNVMTAEATPPALMRYADAGSFFAELPEAYEQHLERAMQYRVDVPRGQAGEIVLWHGGATYDSYFGYTSGWIYFASFYAFTFDGACGAELFEDRIVVHVVDGGCGDVDGTADGIVRHHGAPARLIERPRGDVPSDEEPSGGGGGSPAPLLLAVLALLGISRRLVFTIQRSAIGPSP